MQKLADSIKTVQLIRKIEKLRAAGHEYKQIDVLLDLVIEDTDISYSFELMKVSRRCEL